MLCVSFLTNAQIPTTNIEASYSFTNGSLVDAINGNNFTQNGTALTNANDRFTVVNNAISLNGDYLVRPDIDFPEDVSGFGNEATISFWIKTTTNDSNIRTIFDHTQNRSFEGDLTWSGFYLFLRDGKIGFHMGVRYANGNIGYRRASALPSVVVSDGEWHHIVFTIYSDHTSVHSGGSNNIYNNTSRTLGALYIDEYNVANNNITNTISTNGPVVNTILETHDPNAAIEISNTSVNNLPVTNKYQDEIDDINIYSRVLSLSEIDELTYDGNYCIQTPDPSIISVSSITNTTANINIAQSGTFDIAYHKANEPFSTATIHTNISSGTLNATGLDEFTTYYVFIRKQCSNKLTNWSSYPVIFKTTRNEGRIYVNASATGNNTGVSWSHAYTNLEDAMSNMVDNEEIWIAQGTYTPHVSNRLWYYSITKNGTKIYGGFNGTESLVSQRDAVAYPTILSGDLLGNDDANITFNNASRSDNSYHVIVAIANDVEIDGVTISGGYADAINSSNNRYGAGLLKTDNAVNFKLKNCIIKDNVAYWGSGVTLESLTGTGNITIENCVFDNNLSSLIGSAFYIIPATSATLNITVANCLIKNNKTADNGTRKGGGSSAGQLRAYYNGSVINATITNNTIVNNSNEGTNNSDFPVFGLSNETGSYGTVTIANNIFWGNTKNGGLTATAFGKVTDTNFPSSTTIYNSIDQDGFSNFSNKIATSANDPLFMGTTDFTLQSGSPAIDSGNNSFVTSTEDLNGNTRIFNTIADMGAYEYNPTLSTSSFESNKKEVKLYPNPVTSVLNIKMKSDFESARIMNIQGQQVLESDSKSINASQLPSGLYIIQIKNDLGITISKRFIKQ